MTIPATESGGKAGVDVDALLEFMFRLGQAYLASGEQTPQVELTLRRIATAYGMRRARVVAFPTAIFISIHDGTSERVTLAEGATQIAGGSTLVYEAAWSRSVGKDVSRLAPLAKLFMCHAYRDVTAMCQQVWGGVGFTIEYDIQLYFRRAKQLQMSWWDERELSELVAIEVLDRDPSIR